uniref:Uncharacterized protein n=1 Tax=Anguilla anguilla TaxID=7936 RepID=A0A0E9T744_ANGAN
MYSAAGGCCSLTSASLS